MNGAGSRRKGADFERYIVRYFNTRGFPALRVPLSGAAIGYKGDVEFSTLTRNNSLKAECKHHKRGNGFKTLYNWLDGDSDFVIAKITHRRPIVVVPLDLFMEILNRDTGDG